MSWRMDKNQFFLRGRVFNTTYPRLGDQGQGKLTWKEGRPNTTQGKLAIWVPKRTKSRNKMDAQT
jgi:hypothetical protein